MIHYRYNCSCSTTHLPTGICTECAHHNHHDFVQHTRNGTLPDDSAEQKLIKAMTSDSGTKYRIGSKRHSSCGHPGVWQGSQCAICAQNKRDARAVKTPPPHNNETEIIRKNIELLTEQLQVMQDALKLSEMGLRTGIVRVSSPRQQAISQGNKWYIPYDPCRHCNVVAERYVANGKCRNCGK